MTAANGINGWRMLRVHLLRGAHLIENRASSLDAVTDDEQVATWYGLTDWAATWLTHQAAYQIAVAFRLHGARGRDLTGPDDPAVEHLLWWLSADTPAHQARIVFRAAGRVADPPPTEPTPFPRGA